MATLLYKNIRALTNLCSITMFVTTVVCIVVDTMLKELIQMEKFLELYFPVNGLIYYLGLFCLMNSLVSSTVINSKSKFTMKLFLFYGFIYLLMVSVAILYLWKRYYADFVQALTRMMKGNAPLVRSIVTMSLIDTEATAPTDDRITNHLKDLALDGERKAIHLYSFSFVVFLVTVVLILLGNRCQISKTKVEVPVQTVKTNVGFSPVSLRRQKQQLLPQN